MEISACALKRRLEDSISGRGGFREETIGAEASDEKRRNVLIYLKLRMEPDYAFLERLALRPLRVPIYHK